VLGSLTQELPYQSLPHAMLRMLCFVASLGTMHPSFSPLTINPFAIV